ncbi:MAG: bifunctional 2-C-methyl-D-erythritol 4-phosphate cytidylyltransferase/2-C-methyl-D-erythritol 2,4-cyclodiphosphate synthase [Hyphomicrobiaceae bacterium]
MTTAVLIVAGGGGTRAAKAGEPPKQYAAVAGKAVLTRTIGAFAAHPAIRHVQVVIRPQDEALYDAAIAGLADRLLPWVPGGATRRLSVLAGLDALAPLGPGRVLIHDAARPFVSAAVIDRVLAALDSHAGAIAALPLTDTLKRAGGDGLIAATVDRARLWRAQTPQGFRFEAILAAHRALDRNADPTDDAAVAEAAGLDVALVAGEAGNIKLTTRDDLDMAERILRQPGPDVRVGSGFDVHRFAPGDHVWLCGVRIAHTHTLEGHSDADVGLHALTDALLGTIGDGDIGTHFVNTDPRWKGAASHIFLAEAARRVGERGGRITNADVTLLCEAPKIGPHRDAMRARIAEVLAVAPERVSVKATTTEGLGFTGRREGIAAMASATVIF